MNFNNQFAVFLTGLCFAWWVISLLVVCFGNFELSRIEAYGLGVITGNITSAFILIVQHYYRKKSGGD